MLKRQTISPSSTSSYFLLISLVVPTLAKTEKRLSPINWSNMGRVIFTIALPKLSILIMVPRMEPFEVMGCIRRRLMVSVVRWPKSVG